MSISKSITIFRPLLVVIVLLAAAAAVSAADANGIGTVSRTPAEVEELVEKLGRTPPDWWNSVKLDYPKTLDLSWKDTKQWNNQKNVGQYVWDIVNPNPHRWKSGVKLVHHVLSVNEGNPDVIRKATNSLGHMYGELLGDWARSVFWLRKAGGSDLQLAHCYWKLGCKPMAVKILSKVTFDYTRYGRVIKLWADMGEYKKALQLVKSRVRAGYPSTSYLAAGDMCRLAGKNKLALRYYQQALSAQNDRHDENIMKFVKRRAKANIEAVKYFDMLDISKIADGDYEANSIAYAGQLYVRVAVKDGKIESVKVTKHKDKQFYAALIETPEQIVEKQHVKGVDAVTGATMTSEAIINAAAKALASGME